MSIGREDYQERKEARIDRMEERAARAQAESAAASHAAHEIMRHIPPGQPILVGHHSERHHRRDLDKIDRNMRKSIQADEKAAYYASRAASAASNRAISSDDPDAVEKLEAKLAALQSLQATMKAVNAYYRKHKTLDDCPDLTPETRQSIETSWARGWYVDIPFPSYELSNNNAEIKRTKDRIAQLRKVDEMEHTEIEFDGGTIITNEEINRVQILFDEKPDEATRSKLKSNGFRWSRTEGAWQTQRTPQSLRRACYLLGIDPPKPAPAQTVNSDDTQDAAPQDEPASTDHIAAKEARKQAKNASGKYVVDLSKPHFEVGQKYFMNYYNDDPWEHTAVIKVVKRTACFVSFVHCYGEREETEVHRAKVSVDDNGEILSFGSFYYFHASSRCMTEEEEAQKPAIVKTIEDTENGRKWEIIQDSTNSYSYKYYEYYQAIGWKVISSDSNYSKEAIEFEFDIKLDDTGTAKENARKAEELAELKDIKNIIAENPVFDSDAYTVKIEWCEALHETADYMEERTISVKAAEKIFSMVDASRVQSGYCGYDKWKFQILERGDENPVWVDRYDMGDNNGGFIAFMRQHINGRGPEFENMVSILAAMASDSGIISVSFAPWVEDAIKSRKEQLKEQVEKSKQETIEMIELLTDQQLAAVVLSNPFSNKETVDIARFFLQRLSIRDKEKGLAVLKAWYSGRGIEAIDDIF